MLATSGRPYVSAVTRKSERMRRRLSVGEPSLTIVGWSLLRPMVRVQGVSRRKLRSPEGQQFGDALRRLRKDRGLSQEALAEHASLTADYVGFIERGENVPTLTVILKLADALAVPPSHMLRPFDKRK